MSGGAGNEVNPYVFVEVGPDSLTVNSISTAVVVSEEVDEDMDLGNSQQGESVFVDLCLRFMPVLKTHTLGCIFVALF